MSQMAQMQLGLSKCICYVSHAVWHLSLLGAVELLGSCGTELLFLHGLLDEDGMSTGWWRQLQQLWKGTGQKWMQQQCVSTGVIHKQWNPQWHNKRAMNQNTNKGDQVYTASSSYVPTLKAAGWCLLMSFWCSWGTQERCCCPDNLPLYIPATAAHSPSGKPQLYLQWVDTGQKDYHNI